MSRSSSASAFHKSKTLNDKYLLGDEIGKGAYGRVYKGLDLENGDFVAIKQVSLENIPSEDLASIMQEIDLLKNLNHKNIVKYQGSFKTKTHLYIILEYVENGSLANIIKPNKFGAFPESLVAVYIAQVLEGLVYLHEQGVIHRDIKGANILTTKEGLVKLADFGVATKLTEADVNTHSVVGTPYWMAPEVIEMSGVSAASDIWSVGCTVIELLTCVPPYYDLQPMPALFRIVQDDHPPIPEHVSAAITDFLHKCFKKDAKLRPDARSLLTHPWIRNSRRALKSSLERTGGRIKAIPRDVSTVVERSIEDGEKEDDTRPASEETPSTRDLFDSGSDDELKSNSPSTSSETANSSQKNNISSQNGRRRMQRVVTSNGTGQLESSIIQQQSLLNAVDRLSTSNNSEFEESSKAKRTSSNAQASPELSGVSETFIEDVSQGADDLGSFDVRRRKNEWVTSRGPHKTSSSTTTRADLGEEVNGPLDSCSDGSKLMERSVRPESNGSHHTPQAGKLSTPSSLTRFADTPADGMIDDLFGDESFTPVNSSQVDGAHTHTPGAMSQSSVSKGGSVTSTDGVGGNVFAAKLKLRMAQKKVEGEAAGSAKKDLFQTMIDVVEDDESIDIPHLGFDNEKGRDFLAKQHMEITRLVNLLKPEEPEESIISACQNLVTIFRDYPEQKAHLISQHGIIPLMDMLDVNNNRVIHAVLLLINQIIRDNVNYQENACLAGLIPVIINFAAPDRSREMRMQAASFIQQICLTSSTTLQMFIACRGLPVLVSFLDPDYTKCREMVHLAIDAMWQVFQLQNSNLKNDFCKIFAKSGVLVRLVNTLYSLNEATRLATSGVGTVGNLAITAPSAPAPGVLLRTRSGPLEQSRTTQAESFKPRSGQLDPTRVRAGYMEQHRQITGLIESARPKSPQPHKSAGLPEYLRHLPGQLDQARLHADSTRDQGGHEIGWHSPGRSRPFSGDRDFDVGQVETVRSDVEQGRPLLGREEFARVPLTDPSWYNSRFGNGLEHGHHEVQPLLSLLEKEPPSRTAEYYRHIPSGAFERSDSALPLLLHHAAALRKVNGKVDAHIAQHADSEKQNGMIEHIPGGLPSKPVWNGATTQSPSKLSPTPSAHLSSHYATGLSNYSDTPASSSGTASQRDSGHLSTSGAPSSKPGSSSSPGLLSRTMSTLNADVTGFYVARVADLLLEFSKADTTVKSHMCSVNLLIRLFQMLNKLEPAILVKILKCIKELSTDPFTLEYLQRADAMKHLVPFLEAREGSFVPQIHNQVLNALYNLCKINKRRQEQAAESDIIVHLMYFIKENSPLKQFALPLLCDMAHASRYTREKLRVHRGLEVYLSLLNDEYWAVTALDSLAVCLAHDNEQRKVETALLKKEAVQKLVTFFQNCSEPSFVDILEPFLKIITKSVRLNTALAVSGLTPLLVGKLDHKEAIARLNLLKLIKAVYEHHPRPKQLIVEHDLPMKLRKLIEERRDGERSGGGQVLVKQMATALLKALHINTVL